MNFIKDIVTGKKSDDAHRALIRYSLGTFDRDDLTIKKRAKQIKLQGGLDFVNTFQSFVVQLCTEEVKLSGAIPTVQDIQPILGRFGIGAEAETRRKKLGKKYTFSAELPPAQAQKLITELGSCYLLFDLTSGSNSVIIKKKETPKIGKPAPKFVSAIVGKDQEKAIIDTFLFDAGISSFKDATISHTIVIESIAMDEKLATQDAERARLEAKRKGVLKRKIVVDGNTIEKEYRFEV